MLKFDTFYKLASIQTSAFIADENFTSGKYLKKIYNSFSETFDGEPSVLPLPDGAPQEIPRITISTKNKGKKIEISPVKISFFQVKTSEDDVLDFDCFNTGREFIKELLNSDGVNCHRLAGVINRFALNDEPGLAIASHFCKDQFLEKPFNRPNEFHISSHKRYSFFDRYDVNSWVKIRNGFALNNNKREKTIIVEQDINTLLEVSPETNFYNDDIDFFFAKIGPEFDKILNLYFPGE